MSAMQGKFIFLGVLFALLSGCSESSRKESEFVAGCMQSGGHKKICECAFEKLKSEYGSDGIKSMASGRVPIGFNEKVLEFSGICRRAFYEGN